MPETDENLPDLVTDVADDPIEGAEALGDPGKKALDAMKAERNAERARRRELEAQLEQLQNDAALRDKSAEEQAIEAARQEARAEERSRANARVVRSEVRLAAKGKLADPEDAIAFIDLTQFEVSDEGEVDSAAIDDAIAELISRKPHLGVQRPVGSADQGERDSGSVKQVTSAELEQMSPEQINQARREGRLKSLLGQ